MKRAVLYTRVSTCDQNPETQALDLRRLAEQRGFEIVHEYTDRISGTKAKRPALDQMLAAPTAGNSTPCWFGRLTIWLEACGIF
jgi:DNA invertase Pin-like site-specific DNA recombinase